MLLGATTESNMADILNLEGNTLRAHHRQEVESSPWILSERLCIVYTYNLMNRNKQTDKRKHRSVPDTGQRSLNPDSL